jgi:hypothetical protein
MSKLSDRADRLAQPFCLSPTSISPLTTILALKFSCCSLLYLLPQVQQRFAANLQLLGRKAWISESEVCKKSYPQHRYTKRLVPSRKYVFLIFWVCLTMNTNSGAVNTLCAPALNSKIRNPRNHKCLSIQPLSLFFCPDLRQQIRTL